MAVPRWKDARLYYLCAFRRYEEARVLIRAGYSTGAIYLAGYAVECMLKALVLMAAPSRKRAKVFASFRTNKAHNYEWLRSQYLAYGGPMFPPDITRSFTLVNEWSTELRYSLRRIPDHDADAFMAAVKEILIWGDGRL